MHHQQYLYQYNSFCLFKRWHCLFKKQTNRRTRSHRQINKQIRNKQNRLWGKENCLIRLFRENIIVTRERKLFLFTFFVDILIYFLNIYYYFISFYHFFSFLLFVCFSYAFIKLHLWDALSQYIYLLFFHLLFIYLSVYPRWLSKIFEKWNFNISS